MGNCFAICLFPKVHSSLSLQVAADCCLQTFQSSRHDCPSQTWSVLTCDSPCSSGLTLTTSQCSPLLAQLSSDRCVMCHVSRVTCHSLTLSASHQSPVTSHRKSWSCISYFSRGKEKGFCLFILGSENENDILAGERKNHNKFWPDRSVARS